MRKRSHQTKAEPTPEEEAVMDAWLQAAIEQEIGPGRASRDDEDRPLLRPKSRLDATLATKKDLIH
jgi:hypothetical protein